jgi:hypothetical protein
MLVERDDRMTEENKQASFSQIFIVCAVGIVWFLLNRVDSWFYSMNTDYLRRVLSTDPIAVCIEEGDPSIYDNNLGQPKIVKTIKTFTNCGSIWDFAVKDELLDAHLANVQYVVRHVENAEGFTHTEYIYALLNGDNADLTKTNAWLHEHHAQIGGGYEDYHPHEYVAHMLDHEHDISECSFTNEELNDGVEIGKGPEVCVPNAGPQFVLRIWYQYHGKVYCLIGGGDDNRVMLFDVSSSPNIATEYNYLPTALLAENP